MGEHKAGRHLHSKGQPSEAGKGGRAAPTETQRERKCPTFPGDGVRWDNQGEKALNINAVLERWRPEAESNRCTRICSPLHSHSAIRPGAADYLAFISVSMSRFCRFVRGVLQNCSPSVREKVHGCCRGALPRGSGAVVHRSRHRPLPEDGAHHLEITAELHQLVAQGMAAAMQ